MKGKCPDCGQALGTNHKPLCWIATGIVKPKTKEGRKEMKETVEIVTITPALAATLLLNKAPNRNVTEALVERYAEDLLKGRWMMNGESMILSDKDQLLDGQHRCEACVRTGKSFKTVLTSGVTEAAFKTMNQGKRRSSADVLAIQGEVNTLTLSGACRLLFNRDRAWDPINGSKSLGGKSSIITAQDILNTLDTHPTIRNSVKECRIATAIVPVSMMSFVHCVVSEKGYEEKANTFVEQLTHGEDLHRGDPALTVRNKFLSDKVARSHDLKPRMKLAFLVKGMNALLKNEELRNLKWSITEEFPSIEFPKR